MRRAVPFSAALLLAYVALAAAAFWTAWRDPSGRWVGNDFDPILFIWHLRWLPFALGDGHNPLISNYMAYPPGFNLMWNTSILLPALVLSPVTLLLGIVVSYNVLVTLALALSAWCAYLAFRRYVRREAAAVGGLLYGFSPFMFAQSLNHPHMTLAPFPPLALLLLDETLVQQRRPSRLVGFFLGVAVALQLLTGEEILAATVLVAALGVVLLALLNRSQVRAHVPYAARALGLGAAVAVVLCAVPLGVQLFGAQHVAASSGPVQPKGTFVLDAAELVVPTQRQELSFGSADRLGAKYRGQAEIDGYVGVPLLLLALFVVVRWRRARLVQLAGALAVLTTLLAFGPRLTVGGHTLSSVRMPWVIPQRVPIVENILPARLMLFVFLLLALLVAIFVDRIRVRPVAVAAVVALAFVPLLPNLPYASSAAFTPTFFASGARQLSLGSVALIAPLAGVAGGTTQPMLWQAEADMRFRMPDGYVIRPRGGFSLPEGETTLFDDLARLGRGERLPRLQDRDRANVRCTLRRFDIETVIVGPMPVDRAPTVAFFTKVLERRPLRAGGVAYWPGVSGVSGCA
jgi:Dolichyl-phosphate-mannose-protein mannosyltransferase